MMDSRIRDPQALFRGRGALAARGAGRWSVVLDGPRSEDAGGWFPRDELGQGEWLWIWKWSANYEAEFAARGEWSFSGLAPRAASEGGWVFEGVSPELFWLLPDGARLAVVQEDARGVLRVLESAGDVSLFACQSSSRMAAGGVVIERAKARAHPWLTHDSQVQAAAEWRNLSSEGGESILGGLGLLPVYLLAAEIRSDLNSVPEQGIRRVVSMLLYTLDAAEFDLRRQGRMLFRVSRPEKRIHEGEMQELSVDSATLSWSIRGPRVSAVAESTRLEVSRILELLGGPASTEKAGRESRS